jgi:hypothetical protein
MRHLGDKPQGAGRRHDQTKRVRSQDALPLATLVSAQTIEGARITNGYFHRPAVAIFVQDVEGTPRQIGGEKGFEDRRWFSLSGLFGASVGCTPEHHDSQKSPRPHQAWISAPASLG